MAIMNGAMKVEIAKRLNSDATTVAELEKFVKEMENFVHFAKLMAAEEREWATIREMAKAKYNTDMGIENGEDFPKYMGEMTAEQKNYVSAATREYEAMRGIGMVI